jgi:hypothetical protein
MRGFATLYFDTQIINFRIETNDDGIHHGIRISIHEALAFDYSAMFVELRLLVFYLDFGSSLPQRHYFCGVQ